MRIKRLLQTIPLVALMLSPAAEAAWLQATSSVFQADAEVQKHPSALSQLVVMARDVRRPAICIVYNNTLAQESQGRVVSSARIMRSKAGAEATLIRVLKFAGGVRDGSYLNCKEGPKLQSGDMVLFEHDFKGMPRVRRVGGRREFVEVNGVVSAVGAPKVENIPSGLSLAKGDSPLGLVPGEAGGWHHARNSIFQAESDRQKHPKRVVQRIVMPAGAKRPVVCSAYANNSDEFRRGRILTSVQVFRDGALIQTLNLAGGVRNNEYLGCKKAPRLLPGDLVVFTFELLNMPRLEMGSDAIGFLNVSGLVSTVGEPTFREPPPPPPPPPADPPPASEPPPPTAPPPPTPPPPPPAPGGGGLSAADESAAYKLLIRTTLTQLWRPRGDNPAKYVAVGPGTRVDAGGVVWSTAGVGNTIAAAVSDFERKLGSLGPPGSALSPADRAALVWYSNMNSRSGPTSIRRTRTGAYYGDYYRPGRGEVIVGPFNSIAATVNWFKSEGL